METLTEIWTRLSKQGYESDKGSVHSYLPVYEKILAPYRETALNVLEIGIFKGDSMRMWAEYFTKANIHGIDCSLTPHGGMADLSLFISDINISKAMNAKPLNNTTVHIFDAENETEVASRFKDIKFDVIIEDAGHEINQQLNLYSIWSQYLSKDGIYIIEDVQDIDKNIYEFTELDGYIDLIDLRKVKNRYDDVLIVMR